MPVKVFKRVKWTVKYPKGIGYGAMRAVYLAFSEWNEALYPQILAKTPVSRENRTPGLVKRHLKMMWTTGERRIRYKALGVPGGTVKGTPAYHALMAIKTLHEGRRAVIITGKKMTFPMGRALIEKAKVARHGPGIARGPKNWIFTTKVSQKARGPRNTWITDTFDKNKYMYLNLLRQSVLAERKRTGHGKETVIEIG